VARSSSHLEWARKWRQWIDYLGPEGDWCRQEELDPAMIKLLGSVHGKKVLDAGCGEGRFCRLLAEHGARAVGVDIVPAFVELATAVSLGRCTAQTTRRWPWLGQHKECWARKTQYVVADISRLPRSLNGCFDAVLSCCSLNHVADLQKAVRCIRRVLKGEGICVACLPNPYHVRPFGRTLAQATDGARAFREAVSPTLRITNIYRTFATVVNTFSDCGMYLDRVEEPLIGTTAAHRWANDIREIRSVRGLPNPSRLPWFVVLRFRKQNRG